MDFILYDLPVLVYLLVYAYCLFISYKPKEKTKLNIIINHLIIGIVFAINTIFYLLTKSSNFYISIFTTFIPVAAYVIFTTKRTKTSSITLLFNAYLASYALHLMHITITNYLNVLWDGYLAFMFIPLVIFYLKKIYTPLHELLEKYLPNLLIVLLSFGIVIIAETYLFQIIMPDTSRLILRYNIFALGTMVVYFFSILFFRIIIKFYSEQMINIKDNEVIEQQINDLERLLKSREANEQKLRIIRHDLRHIMTNISNLISIGKYDEALEYTKLYFDNIENTTNKVYCRDYVINTVLDHYSSICEQHDIKFDVIVNDFEKDLKILNYEIATFISNCLENAVNACNKLKENKNITFKFLNNDGRLALQIKNSFDGNIMLNEANHPVTNKKNHGIGTRSILGFADRNNLFVDYEIEDKIFTINVLFPEK
ncbi:MAG: GHKL domain-containing protein [Acholeplasmatales bacterium]|nr:GHKL domain-containing protein [Acholeplasmatales bacterium]